MGWSQTPKDFLFARRGFAVKSDEAKAMKSIILCFSMPLQPTLLQNRSLHDNLFGAIHVVKIALNHFTMQIPWFFPCKKRDTSGSDSTTKILWWNYFCKITK